MKVQKKIIVSIFIAISISCMLFSVNVKAMQVYNVGNIIETKIEKDGTVSKIIELTEAEYVIRLSEASGISLEEAQFRVNKTKSSTFDENSTSYIGILGLLPFHHYREYIVTKDFGGGYFVEAGALAVIYSYGSFRNIISIDNTWTMATGSGTYTWHEAYRTASENGYSIIIQARGVVEVKVDISTQAGVTLGSELLGFGFNTTICASTTKYYRKAETWSKTWNLYH